MTALHHTLSMQHAEEKCTVHLAARRDIWCDCMFQISFACSQLSNMIKIWWAGVHVWIQASVASTMQHASQISLMRQWGFLTTWAVALLQSGVVLSGQMPG